MTQTYFKGVVLLFILYLLQNELDASKNELASQRIAFEEEKLARLEDRELAPDSEAEALRIKLKQQVRNKDWTEVGGCVTVTTPFPN